MHIPTFEHTVTTLAAVVLLVLAVLFPALAEARLSGLAELGYTKYDSKTDGTKRFDANSFQQRYSLLYDSAGYLMDKRIGQYNLSIGYEWGSFDTEIKTPDTTVNPSISAGHVLFNGELLIDPRELPFRLKAYSRDLNRLEFSADTLTVLRGTLFGPNVPTNLRDGINVTSGATLVLGVKNGITNGYNSIFRHIPMLMVDYRDDLHRDLKSQTPVHNRLQRLAFVSLNKRDNWFHFRKVNYRDYINLENSYEESQYQLGTVDQNLDRRWVDLTNWIKISADIQLTERSGNDQRGSLQKSFDQYDVNLFGIATRQRWEARTFNTFTRMNGPGSLQYIRKTPLYLSGSWGSETDWRVSFSSEEQRRTFRSTDTVPANPPIKMTDELLMARIDTFKRSKFTLGQTVSVETSNNTGNRHLTLSARTETASTRRFSDVYGLFFSYFIKRDAYESAAGSEQTLLEQRLNGKGTYAPSTSLRLELEENLTISSGTRDISASPTLLSLGSSGSASVPRTILTQVTPESSYTRSTTTFTVSWTPLARLNIGLGITEDILVPRNQPTEYLTTLRNTVDYSAAGFSLRLALVGTQRYDGGGNHYVVSANTTASYTPTRQVFLEVRGNLAKEKSQATDTTFIDLIQNFSYSIYKTNGANRRVLELNESLSYNQLDRVASPTTARRSLTLGFKYYPLKQMFIGATGKYTLYSPDRKKELISTATLGVVFPKLQVNFDYSYGRVAVSGGGTTVDNRLSANVKKPF